MYLLFVKVVTLFPSKIIQLAEQLGIRLISQLIKCVSRVLQKLLISTFIVPTLLVSSINLNSSLNDSDFAIAALFNGGWWWFFFLEFLNDRRFCFISSWKQCQILSSFQICNISMKFQMFWNNEHYIILNFTLALQYQSVLPYRLVCYLFCLYSWWAKHNFVILLTYQFYLPVLHLHLILLHSYGSFNRYICITIILYTWF